MGYGSGFLHQVADSNQKQVRTGMEKSLCGVTGLCIASVAESDSQELGLQMLAWVSLLVSIVALAVSIKALRESRWIEIDWNFTDDDE